MRDQKGREAASFEDRLEAARRKQGLDAPDPDSAGAGGAPKGGNALAVGLRVGVEMLAALVVAVAIGWWLDKYLHTSPIFLAVFVLLGGAAGVANVWRLMAPGRMTPPK
jgi:ATP synthase protein I